LTIALTSISKLGGTGSPDSFGLKNKKKTLSSLPNFKSPAKLTFLLLLQRLLKSFRFDDGQDQPSLMLPSGDMQLLAPFARCWYRWKRLG
jgi:hypothetical protein